MTDNPDFWVIISELRKELRDCTAERDKLAAQLAAVGEHRSLPFACTLCGSCTDICPVCPVIWDEKK